MQIIGSNPSSTTTATVTIRVDSSNGTLTITKDNNCTEKSDTDNPSPGWTKKTYTPKSGTITISVTPSGNNKGLEEAIKNEKTAVEELNHYTNNDNHEVLRLKKDTNFYIYYMTNTGNNNWKKYGGTINNAQDAVSTVINNELSNRVEIQLERTTNQNYGLIDVSDKQINVADATSVPGYTGYKHSRTASGGFTIEKIRYKGSEIGGIVPTGGTIPNVDEVNVYYDQTDSELKKPLLLYTKTTGGNYTYYGRGMKNFQMHWRDLRPGETTELTADDLKPHLYMMSR